MVAWFSISNHCALGGADHQNGLSRGADALSRESASAVEKEQPRGNALLQDAPREFAARLHDNGNKWHGRDGRDAHEGATQQPSDGWSAWPIRCDRHERIVNSLESSRRNHELRRSWMVSASARHGGNHRQLRTTTKRWRGRATGENAGTR